MTSSNFIQGLLKKNENKLARSFNFTFRYIDDVISLNNSRFGDFVDRIYPIELEIKDTTDTDRYAEKPLYEVCLIRIKEQVDEKSWSPWVENTSTKENKYVVNQKLDTLCKEGTDPILLKKKQKNTL
jgi:hypothetical protein